MFERLSYIPGFLNVYSRELSSIESAADRMQARIEREQAGLVRMDGSPKYAPQEHQERETAIIEAATAEYDKSVSRYTAKAEQEAADLKKTLAQLEGADGWERLTESQRQTAAARREFVREDAQTLPASDLAQRARAAIAAGNLAECWLLKRYIAQRTSATDGSGMPAVRRSSDLELLAVVRDLGALFGEQDRATRRREIEAKVRAAESFPIAVSTARNAADGSNERMVAQMRQRYGSI